MWTCRMTSTRDPHVFQDLLKGLLYILRNRERSAEYKTGIAVRPGSDKGPSRKNETFQPGWHRANNNIRDNDKVLRDRVRMESFAVAKNTTELLKGVEFEFVGCGQDILIIIVRLLFAWKDYSRTFLRVPMGRRCGKDPPVSVFVIRESSENCWVEVELCGFVL